MMYSACRNSCTNKHARLRTAVVLAVPDLLGVPNIKEEEKKKNTATLTVETFVRLLCNLLTAELGVRQVQSLMLLVSAGGGA